jgi:hypothetical protein
MLGFRRQFIVRWSNGSLVTNDTIRAHRNSLLGALLRDPDNRGTRATRPRRSNGHGGAGRKRQERCQKPGDRSLVHSIFSIRTFS